MDRVYLNAFNGATERVRVITRDDGQTTYVYSNGETHTCVSDDCAEVNVKATSRVAE